MDKADRIKEARIRAGLTQEELAAECNTTKQTIYKYEQRIVTNIPTDKIEMIAKATGVSEAYIMGWEDKEAQLVLEAEALADAAHDRELMDAIIKIQKMNDSQKVRVYGYIDAIFGLGN